ncbi:MAG: hypothetical protein AAGJ82_06215 [Bacteroidota bacterium]
MGKGYIKITNVIKTNDDESFYTERAVLLRLENVGTTRLWIDERIVLEPGEAFIEGDLSGPGIDHKYTLRFLGAPPKAVTVDVPKIYAGDRVHIRLFKRQQP